MIYKMAEALPHPSANLQPTNKPNLPGSILELDITPEKFPKKDKKRHVKGCKKRVGFSDDNEIPLVEKQVLHGKEPQQYPSLENPQLNSTYGVTKQMAKLKMGKSRIEKKQDILPEATNMQIINDKATTVLNFKRNEKHFKDLVSIDIDKDRELTKMAPKRTVYDKEIVSHNVEQGEEDVMVFWTDDLITDNPKLDYDKDIEETSLQPDTSINSLEYLADLYYCKEITSQFR